MFMCLDHIASVIVNAVACFSNLETHSGPLLGFQLKKASNDKIVPDPVGSAVKSGLKSFRKPTVHFASHVAADDSRFFQG